MHGSTRRPTARRAFGSLCAGLLVITSACGGNRTGDDAEGDGDTAELSSAGPEEWPDGLGHLSMILDLQKLQIDDILLRRALADANAKMELTDPEDGADGADGVNGSGGADLPPVNVNISGGGTPGSGGVLVPSAGNLPPGLVAVAPETPEEQAALDAAGGGAVIVEDADGNRYIKHGDTLTPLGPRQPPPATIPAPEPGGSNATTTTAAPALNDTNLLLANGDAALIELLLQMKANGELPGLRDIIATGQGVYSLVTEKGKEESVADTIRRLDPFGAIRVESDLLLDVQAGPQPGQDADQWRQWALTNSGSNLQTDEDSAGVLGADVAAPAAWTVTTGLDTVVAVIDTGVELDHPDLANSIWRNDTPLPQTCDRTTDGDRNGWFGDCYGWDFGDGDPDPSAEPGNPACAANPARADWPGHGTEVAGVIAAAKNGGGTVGVAPGTQIMPLKVMNAQCVIPTSAIIAAIRYATAEGAHVISLAIGTQPGRYTPDQLRGLEAAIYAAADLGVFVALPAGNLLAGAGPDAPSWPAGFAGHSGVMAVGASDNRDRLEPHTNTASPVTIVAPGRQILTTTTGKRWGFRSGTSFAAAHVAAAAALVISQRHQASLPALSPYELEQQIANTADAIGDGYGRLNVAAAVGADRAIGNPDGVAVTWTGTGSYKPDQSGKLGLSVTAPAMTGISAFRLSIAIRKNGAIHAVEGVDVLFTDALGPLSRTKTAANGEFPELPLRDADRLVSGAALTLETALPEGDYAFVLELLNAGGESVGDPYVAYLEISPRGSDDPVPASTLPPRPTTPPGPGGPGASTTAPGTPTTITPPTTVPGATTTTTVAPTTGTTSTTSTLPGDAGDGEGDPTSTTRPPDGGDDGGGGDEGEPTETTEPACAPATSTSTTEPDPCIADDTSTTAAPDEPTGPSDTTEPDCAAEPTSTTSSTTSTTEPDTTLPAGPCDPGDTGPTTTVPYSPTTTGAPTAPRCDETTGYCVGDLDLSDAVPCAGTVIHLFGHFPTVAETETGIYVWFGDSMVTATQVTEALPGRTLRVVVPANVPAGYAVMTVRFVLAGDSGNYEPAPESEEVAFGDCGGGSGPTIPAPPTTPTTTTEPEIFPPGDGSSTSTTQPDGNTTTADPDGPATTAGGGGGGAGGGTSTVTGKLGDLILHSTEPGSALARLTLDGWAEGCHRSSCPTVLLPVPSLP